jgi:hypothetical protein
MNDTDESTAIAIAKVCDDLKAMLLEKNRAYGNSALNPVRVFSSAEPEEQLNVRMDDKLSRIVRGEPLAGESAEWDLTGYLVLKEVARRSSGGRAFDHEAHWRKVFFDPGFVTPELICLHLGREPRYFAHGIAPVTVAEHSLLVSSPFQFGPLRRKALVHDFGEAFTGDVPLPIKGMFPALDGFCRRIQTETLARLSLPEPTVDEAAVIKIADRAAFAAEVRFLFTPQRATDFIAAEEGRAGPIDYGMADRMKLRGLDAKVAAAELLAEYRRLA